MKIIKLLFSVFVIFYTSIAEAQEIQSIKVLFDSLKSHPVSIGDEIRTEQALAMKSIVKIKLYPNVDIFGRYDYASTATGMIPVAPNDLLAMVKDPAVAQPFSDNIIRLGATISMPVFVASIFPLVKKAKMMARSAEDQKRINILKNEAVIVGANASLLYMQALDSSLTKKKNSLLKTKEFVIIKVNNGRAPESALLNIDNGISQIDILKNELALQQEEVKSVIQSLTGVVLNQPVKMLQVGNWQEGKIKALDPLKEKTEADRLGYRAEKVKLVPSIVLLGSYSNNSANSYNNDQHVNNDYSAISLIVRFPLFAGDQYAQIKKSRLDYVASRNDLDQMTLELTSQTSQLQNSLKLLDSSIQLYGNSINDEERLLVIARVGYQTDQLSMEDYLKYEDDLVLEQSKLFKAQAQKWQILMKLCVIYGNNIEEIVK